MTALRYSMLGVDTISLPELRRGISVLILLATVTLGI